MERTTIENRKKDHLDLATQAQVKSLQGDERFRYEPLFHPLEKLTSQAREFFDFAGGKMLWPLWISSMTGGAKEAKTINQRLAQACGQWGLGMGLGSCRPLLEKNPRWEDFKWRHELRPETPFWANLGITQVEEALRQKSWNQIEDMVHQLEATGLIIHINLLQEWLQPEGECPSRPVEEILRELFETTGIPLMAKEVGQGFGPKSLEFLMSLPFEAIELGALGGTNFSLLEILRRESDPEAFLGVAQVGHTAREMVVFALRIIEEKSHILKCKKFILSGGIGDFLEGHFLMEQFPREQTVYGQAHQFLKAALKGPKELDQMIESQVKGLLMARSCLEVTDLREEHARFF